MRSWENLARLGPMQMKEFAFGAYYVCWAVKPCERRRALKARQDEIGLKSARLDSDRNAPHSSITRLLKGGIVLESSLSGKIRTWKFLTSRYGSAPPSA
jgi:hypothetical protein